MARTWYHNYDPSFKETVESAIMAGIDHSHGWFAHESTINPAPNPGLDVQGCGPIGLPLSADAARTLISVCEQAPFGRGERMVVDRDVRDTWQVNAEKVRFTNPGWPDFVQKSVEDVCSTLGIEAEGIGLKCELYKLLVYEKGSHFLPHVDTEKQDGMFATMVIVLPSLFEGGTVHLNHGNQIKIIGDGGPLSAFQTSVLAWYTDVMHEVKPVTSGYRLALSYNLIRSNPSYDPLPGPAQDPSTATLTESLSTWVKALQEETLEVKKNVPLKLAWLLEHRYSRVNMRLSALKGKDAHLVKRIRPIANDLGLRLGLAIVTLTLGPYDLDDYDGDVGEQIYQGYSVEPPPGISRDLEYLVDLEGHLVSDSPGFSYDFTKEMMPQGWEDILASQKADDREVEQTGNEPQSVSNIYCRVALVIWPANVQP